MFENTLINISFHVLFFLALAILNTLITKRILVFSITHDIYDVPNERSSHTKRTPIGGGLGIASITISALIALALFHYRDVTWNWFIISGALFVLIVSFIDDVKHIKPITRLFAHFIAAGIIVYAMGPSPELRFLPFFVLKGIPAQVFTFFYIVWMINLFNFMDGIDGLAGVQTVSVALLAMIFAWLHGYEMLCLIYLVLAATSLGFLAHNWAPARIFMGDTGSCTLGYLIAALSLWGELKGGIPLVTIMIIMGIFIVDATYTLLRRLITGEKIHHAHTDHTFQHIIQRDFGHARVSAGVFIINVIWLAPFAYLSMTLFSHSFLFLVIAYLPLVITAFYFKAGVRNSLGNNLKNSITIETE